ncbi:MAG: imidazoleglycerol-phosphate dehydratase HisB [Leptospiraceae bacterium]|nr:imidazoleglycerol-phosphate dehydratase HisB [Leptospiraceae bacterium]
MATTSRTARHERQTSETSIQMDLNLDGRGSARLDTEIPFFEHMLGHICKQSMFDMELDLRGDLAIDGHHSVEDTAIVFGKLLAQALGEKRGIRRYGHFMLPMDEVLVSVAIDLSGRYHFQYTGPDSINTGKFGVYDAELSLEFLRKFAMYAAINLHIIVHYGENRHHIHEGIFKALGKSLRMAVSLDPALGDSILSTKGVLE